MLIDGHRRKIEYLRLSVTDLCNLRCHYCLPPEGVDHRQRSEILTFEEIERLVAIFVGLGVRRVRVTGGEPLVRKNLPELIQKLNRIPGLEEVLLTTNGILLRDFASKLKESGLQKINIHLDTLSPEKFRQITRGGNIEKVHEGIKEARRVGFDPIKLNVVLQRGINDEEADDLLVYAARNQLIPRFIELMPIGPAQNMNSFYLEAVQLRRYLEAKYTLTPIIGYKPGAGPAVYYQVAELGIPVGFISPLSQSFCDTCNRIRISSDGRFQDCLAFDGAFSLRDLLRNPRLTDDDVCRAVVNLLHGKREGHNGFVQNEPVRTPLMCGIGG